MATNRPVSNSFSDRGSLKDLVNKIDDPYEESVSYSPAELRFKKLLDFADENNLKQLRSLLHSSMGFISTNETINKDNLPLTIHRIRSTVNEIKSKVGNEITEMQNLLDNCFYKAYTTADNYLKNRALVKTASTRKPSFWRVIK